MDSSNAQILVSILSETEPLMARVDELPAATAVELYAIYEQAAKGATQNIGIIDPEIRVMLCDRQDQILERIVDANVEPEKPMEVRGIYTPALERFRRWKNIELLKDKGLTGYMLANELNAHPVMLFGTKPEDYPYKALLPELELLYKAAEPGNPRPYVEHLIGEHAQMDVLVLHGMYNTTAGYLNEYRSLRPDGKVYCGLDMNSRWMKDAPWGSHQVNTFSKQCNVVATSCRWMRDELNRNPAVSFPCRWLPNAFFNPFQAKVVADAQIKKNIILTVGRIGTHQKDNAELLMAFEKAHTRLPGWELRLVGSIEPEFRQTIADYFSDFPYMRECVTFTGTIVDKTELYKEYAQAKVFAFTSFGEGGAPNVYAEALFHGCMFVTSNIDAADDITNFGELGVEYQKGDLNELADALVKVGEQASDNRTLSSHITKALHYANRYYDWHRNAKKLAYMLYGTREYF